MGECRPLESHLSTEEATPKVLGNRLGMKWVCDPIGHFEACGGSLPKSISSTHVPWYAGTSSTKAFKAKSDRVSSTPGNRKVCRSPLKVLHAGILTQFL